MARKAAAIWPLSRWRARHSIAAMKRIAFWLLALTLTACATTSETQKDTAKADYEKAKHMLANGQYADADLFLEKFGANHPYSQYTIQAELLRIFAAYKAEEYVLSETLAEEFVNRHPRHPNVDYAQYMLGMSHLRESSPAEKDQTQTLAAIESFRTLLRKYPKSAYAGEARRHLQRLYNRLAKHELDVGKFYFDHQRYVAAANRFQVVLEKYQTTPSIEEALYYLAASWHHLGLKHDARITALLLRHNYPKSEWSQKAETFLR